VHKSPIKHQHWQTKHHFGNETDEICSQ